MKAPLSEVRGHARWIPYLPLGAAGRYLQPTGFGTLGHAPPVLVFDNGGYGEIRDETAARGDTPTAVDHAPVDLPALARAYGGQGTRACGADEPAAALTEALRTPGPTLIAIPEETR
ncbi:thiamine pyrophosphate-dependent enzyme [Streptomyces sp. NBC_01615]|uniref:thiamine pyrophosphate-dependent enzyme n=1 Tax=Streptomyces sp. NBC_01615 TaxID=2975898 RepID=UPI00386ABC53